VAHRQAWEWRGQPLQPAPALAVEPMLVVCGVG
jgi:hypothetical protein